VGGWMDAARGRGWLSSSSLARWGGGDEPLLIYPAAGGGRQAGRVGYLHLSPPRLAHEDQEEEEEETPSPLCPLSSPWLLPPAFLPSTARVFSFLRFARRLQTSILPL
jgi:hypothetical protein